MSNVNYKKLESENVTPISTFTDDDFLMVVTDDGPRAISKADILTVLARTALASEYGVSILRDAGVVGGGYTAARSVRSAVTLKRFFAEVHDGSAVIWVKVNDVEVHGPVVVSEGSPVTQVIDLTIPQGSSITFEVVPTGVTRLWSQIDGGSL